MKKINKQIIFGIMIVLVMSLAQPGRLQAATTPDMGIAEAFGILADTFTNTTPGTVVNGDLGYTTGPAVPATVSGDTYVMGITYDNAGVDQAAALAELDSQPCTFTFAGAVDLSTDTTHGTAGVYTTGVYCSPGAMSISGPLDINGIGTFIFRPVGALNSTAGAVVTLSGSASACDVFWTPTGATTFGANTTFTGTVIDNAGITVGANTVWTGRALAFEETITTDTTTITVPTCVVSPPPPPPPPPAPAPATLNVIKSVVNDNGGTTIASGFTMHVKSAGVDISGSPVAGAASPGTSYSLSAGTYVISEDANASYVQSFSGDCDSSGSVVLLAGENKTCTIINDDIAAASSGGGGGGGSSRTPVPPLIDIVKVPNPLALPGGPGLIEYIYTLHNTGTVSVGNVTLVGDTCIPIVLLSGDTDVDARLDVNEIWTYSCSIMIFETHTSTVVATAWANNLSAVDSASTTVVLGAAIIPPLIHVTKVPNPLTLPVVGGMVTYTNKVSNPGLAALSNVRVNDNKCGPVNYISGDINGDSQLDPEEIWEYTCQVNLIQTTTNTVTAVGDANGLTATDTAITTVVVATRNPVLPAAGFGPETKTKGIVLLASILAAVSLFAGVLIKRMI